MKSVQLIYFDAGGGHRAAAQALTAQALAEQRPWAVQQLNLFDLIDPKGRFRKLTGMAPEAYYNQRLARGWTLGLAQELRLLQGLIKLGHGAMHRQLQRHWLASEPDLVVSLVPNFNRVMCQSLAGALPGVPYVTVMTDLADHPPHFWIEPGQRQHVVCGTPAAVAQARAAGHREGLIHATSGMILRPSFYGSATGDRAASRQALGLPAEAATGVVMFGGQGSRQMLRIAELLPETPLILLCGHNRALAEALRALPASAPRVVIEHTQDVAGCMRLGDFFIGKPGPGSLSEAWLSGLPVIVTRNAMTMPQERYNTDFVREQGLGLVLKSFGDIGPAVAQMVSRLAEFRQRLRGHDNRAVFEVPGILAGILEAREPVPGWQPSRPVPVELTLAG